MSFRKNHYAEHIDYVELTPPASRTLEVQSSRRNVFALALVALLLVLCAMASAQVAAAVKSAGIYYSITLPPLLLW